MASGNNSSLGSSLFRGALHGNTSSNNTNLSSSSGSGGSHHHHHHHHHSAAHHLQQPSVSGSSHLHHSQPPAAPQPQSSLSHLTFTSEDISRGRGTPRSPDHMSTVMAKLWFERNVESSLSILRKEEHEKRTRDLRKQLEYIADTNWKYSPIEKYIGQQ